MILYYDSTSSCSIIGLLFGGCGQARAVASGLRLVKHDRKGRPLSGLRGDCQFTAMPIQNVLHDSKSQTGATLLAARVDIDAVESLNEEVPTNNLDKLRQIVAFDVAVSDEVARRASLLNRNIAAVLLNIAVGNPEHSEMEYLLPVADKCVQHGHFIGYHSYFPCHPDYAEEWFVDYAFDYHLRCESMQQTFDNYGLRPQYLYTEAGAVAVEVVDGKPGALNAGAGWRHPICLNGNLPRYLNLLLRLKEMDELSQSAMIFTTGADFIGWDYFLFNGPELDALATRLGE